MKSKATLLALMLLAAAPAAVHAQSAPVQQGVTVGSDSLVGSTVRDPDGRDVGKVSRLMIDPVEGRITSVIIATGGTLGVGANTISVPWSSVKIGQDAGKVIVTASQTLDSAPPRMGAPAADTPPRRQ